MSILPSSNTQNSDQDHEVTTVKAAWDAKERLKAEGYNGGLVVCLSPRKMHTVLSLIYANAAQGDYKAYGLTGNEADVFYADLKGSQLNIERVKEGDHTLKGCVVGFKDKTDCTDFNKKVDTLSKTIDTLTPE